jgi:hypothetical protein
VLREGVRHAIESSTVRRFDETRSSRRDEVGSADGMQSGGVHGEERWRNPASELTLVAGLDAAVAVGAGAARTARAAVVRPAAATSLGLLPLGWQLVPGVAAHPLLAS